jgi:hypothetical protein
LVAQAVAVMVELLQLLGVQDKPIQVVVVAVVDVEQHIHMAVLVVQA